MRIPYLIIALLYHNILSYTMGRLILKTATALKVEGQGHIGVFSFVNKFRFSFIGLILASFTFPSVYRGS